MILLGTGTCQLGDGRAASATLIERPALRLVYDFGRGTAQQLVGIGLRQDDVRHVVLSHFHTDHWSDLLPYLQAASHSQIDPRGVDLEIHATRTVVDKLTRLFELFAPGELIDTRRYQVRLRPFRAGRLVLDDHEFELVHLPPADNHGLRWRAGGATWALTGDSHFHRRAVEFLRGVDVAVIDAGHPSDDEIVELAVASGVERLVCSHLYRELDGRELERRARRRGFEGRLEVGRDLQILTAGDARPEADRVLE